MRGLNRQFFSEPRLTSAELSKEMLFEKNELTPGERFEFDYRDESYLTAHFVFPQGKTFTQRSKIHKKDFAKLVHVNVEVCIETSIEERKSFVTDGFEFVNRHETLTRAHIESSQTSKLVVRDQRKSFFDGLHSHMCELFGRDIKGRN